MAKRIYLRDVDAPEGFYPNANISAAEDLGVKAFGENLQIEVLDESSRELASYERQPGIYAAADPMETNLIEPVRVADAADTTACAWGVSAVGADNDSYDGSGVVVAVLDTGIDRKHPAFDHVKLVEEDFTGTSIGDRNGHGTHCAGIIFGRDVGGRRIGVARGVNSALIGKVLKDDGSGTSDWVFQGLHWALQKNANVVSLSLALNFERTMQRYERQGKHSNPAHNKSVAFNKALVAYGENLRMFDTILQLYSSSEYFGKRALIVAASGNDSNRQQGPYPIHCALPGWARGVISVGAVQQNGRNYTIADFSNAHPSVVAPGVDIVSAKAGGGYVTMSGTSMACPHAAGVAALWWQKLHENGNYPKLSEITARVLTADRSILAPGSLPADIGAGLVKAP